MNGGHLRRLTSLRWFAALAVFGCHVSLHRHGLSALAPGGALGVGFFFTLSGFVLTWSIRPGESARRFWLRRFARIYPATVVSTLAAVALWWLPRIQVNRWLAADVTLTQAWFPSLSATGSGNRVTWSLACEAFFYALLPVLLPMVRRWPRAAVCVALAAVAVGFAVSVQTRWYFAYYNPLFRLPEFVLGIAMAVAVQRGWRPKVHPVTAGAVFVTGYVVATNIRVPLPLLQVHVMLAGVVLVLAVAVGRDMAGVEGWLTSRPAVYLGELSFCFYLTHYMCLQLVSAATNHVAVVAGVGFALSFVSASALHHGAELPAQRRILRRISRTNRAGATAPSPAPVSAF